MKTEAIRERMKEINGAELKPCPRCGVQDGDHDGGLPLLSVDQQDRGRWVTKCAHCGNEDICAPSHGASVYSWNTRPIEAELITIIGSLLKERDKRDAKTALSPQTDKVLEECEWSQEDPSGDFDDTWQTGCGNLFSFTEGGPSDNNFEFCCYCGKKLSPS